MRQHNHISHRLFQLSHRVAADFISLVRPNGKANAQSIMGQTLNQDVSDMAKASQ